MIEALLERIGLARMPRADVDGLFALHRAFLERVPYEALAVQLGEAGPLDISALAARICRDGRGGYCFELNTVLAELLRACGFAVTHHQAIVDAADATNHMALVVEAEGSRWLADAGLGEGFLDPLPLRSGAHRVGPLTYTLAELDDGRWRFAQHPWGSMEGFVMAREPSPVAAFEVHHRRLSTSPESSFVRTLVVQRPRADRIVTLRARSLTERGPAVDSRRVVGSSDELAAALRDEFGIALGGSRLARVWERAAAQHEAFLARA